ncbi:hypothetical protein TNIN_108861 [Trichonephila inaurata madagascariensis]|uniref:Uncharacterized protein n=1 Tax=Trichonephila inaurata madagascariensis TaxID=2747483 RepID=A0A8X6X3R0_9ARAC|nr:hypothetical protein TNIN_108861 [Trichonephila inaurata madagascariensis]
MACRSLIWVTFCTCVVFCAASPTRRQFISITETTSSEPVVVVTKEGAVWDDNDDFDLDGDEDWMGEEPASPSSIPQRNEYEEYDDDDDDDDEYASKRGSSNEEEDIEHQDAEEGDEDVEVHDAEFLFLPSRDTRLVLQDDDEQSGPIKVRHTGKNSYPEVLDGDNSIEDSSKEDKSEDSEQFEFTIDNDEGDERNNEVDDKDDFVLEDSEQKDNSLLTKNDADLDDDDEDDDDDNFVVDDDNDADDDPMFESPEEDSQVIYGDHVFLY